MSASEIAQLKKQSVIQEFQRHELDTGSTEVQVAVLTNRILKLAEHMSMHKKDKYTKRRLLMAVLQRNRTLKYMRRVAREKYEETIAALQIRPTKNFDPTILAHPHAKGTRAKGLPADHKPKKRKRPGIQRIPYGQEKTAKGLTRMRKHAVRQQRLQRQRDAVGIEERRQVAVEQRRVKAMASEAKRLERAAQRAAASTPPPEDPA